jgi:transcriptional regulator with XRE-family HTH domain
MNKDIFIKDFSRRLQKARKAKYKTQRSFADAYKEKYGTIRKAKNSEEDSDMFGTIQSWEQGKTLPDANALSNICDLLDCDADFLLGRIPSRTHDLNDVRNYTGLPESAALQLHAWYDQLTHPYTYEEWEEHVRKDDEQDWYQSYGFYLILELLIGSPNYRLDASNLYNVIDYMEGNVLCDENGKNINDKESIDEIHRDLDKHIYYILTSVRDILMDNACHGINPEDMLND